MCCPLRLASSAWFSSFALDVGVVATHLKSRCLYHILHTIPRNNLNRTMDEIGKEMPDSALKVIRVALRTGEWA